MNLYRNNPPQKDLGEKTKKTCFRGKALAKNPRWRNPKKKPPWGINSRKKVQGETAGKNFLWGKSLENSLGKVTPRRERTCKNIEARNPQKSAFGGKIPGKRAEEGYSREKSNPGEKTPGKRFRGKLQGKIFSG